MFTNATRSDNIKSYMFNQKMYNNNNNNNNINN